MYNSIGWGGASGATRQPGLARHAERMDLGSAYGMLQVEVFDCRSFDDAQSVALAVRERRTVVLQLDQLEPGEAQRVVDFISGAVHALEGRSERLGNKTFLFVPSGVALSSLL